MKRVIVVVAALSLILAVSAWAGPPKSYQVTGPVVEVKDDLIVVEKGKEKWEIAKDKDTKVTGDLKPGAKVEIKYQMKASSIEVKGEAKREGKQK